MTIGSRARASAFAAGMAYVLVLTACSEESEPQPHSSAGYGGIGGIGAFGNPDGGGQLFANDGAVCAPDDDECIDENTVGGPDGGAPHPGRDAAVADPHDDGGMRDAAAPDRDATVEESEPDAEVIPPDDGGTPTAATYKIDLLFVIDNSSSMVEEQTALRAQFPSLISLLLHNTAIGGGDDVVAGAQDIHLGVVSTDLGTPGVTGVSGCSGLGDDGLLNDVAAADAVGCSASVYTPRFLSYVAGSGDPAQVATDLGCIAALGTDGCGFEQQLESMLKALWPGDDGRVRFANDPATGLGMNGQSGAAFPNGDFVRNDDADDVSVLAVVLVTDEEDCSSNTTLHFQPETFLPADDPRRMVSLNLRCYYESEQPEPNGLFDVARYVDGLRALRPGYEQRVVFGAIVGVPTELVTEAALSAVDFGEAAQRDAYYEAILDHPLMQQRVDDRGTPDYYDDNLMPSCTSPSGGGDAYPPRRIVEVARGFGEHGFVQSICADDWSYAMELLATRIAQARSE